MPRSLTIAIDGPAGSGKSTTAAGVARKLRIVHLDTGAMYRAVTLKALRLGVGAEEKKLGGLCRKVRISFRRPAKGRQRVFLDGQEVTAAIRSQAVTRAVSEYCRVPVVRRVLVSLQRAAAKVTPSVLEGRDIGTVVLPRAPFKFFLTASLGERARRRWQELRTAGRRVPLSEVRRDLLRRDQKDRNRSVGPLKKAPDAVAIDTTRLTAREQIEFIVKTVRKK